MICVAHDPDIGHLVSERAAFLINRILDHEQLRAPVLMSALRQGWFRRTLGFLERMSIPGITLHYALRKRCIEEAARKAIEDGAGQVVVLAAGYDVLGTALAADYPEVVVFEIDHPATQAPKRAALEGDGGVRNLHFIPLDLRTGELVGTLRAQDGYDPEKRTLFIAEGLTMYLQAHEVEDILRAVREVAGPSSSIVFTYMARTKGGSLHFRSTTFAVRLWLRLKGEPFSWGLEDERVEGYLREKGLGLGKIVTHAELRQTYLDGAPARRALAEGERICTAQRLD